MRLVWIVILVFLVALAGVSIWIAFQRPDFVSQIISYVATAAAAAIVPSIFKAFVPKPIDKDKVRRGEDPFRKRPREH